MLETARYIPIGQLSATDNCGFSPFCDTPTTRGTAFAKIRSRVIGIALAVERPEWHDGRERRKATSIRCPPERQHHPAGPPAGARRNCCGRRRSCGSSRSGCGSRSASIGDAVIATDAEGRVTFMNGVAETLTGWAQGETKGRLLPDVFHTVDEHTRLPVENPALLALEQGRRRRAGKPHRADRPGRERAVDRRQRRALHGRQRRVIGSVLVFRDVTEGRRGAARPERGCQPSSSPRTTRLSVRRWTASSARGTPGPCDYSATLPPRPSGNRSP